MNMRSRFLWRAMKTRYRDNRVELSALKSCIESGDVVCDIGANKGSFLFWLSKWVGEGEVVAFEPQAELAGYLERVTGALGMSNVVVENKAVSSASGTAKLFVPGGGVSAGASLSAQVARREECASTEVEVVSLDDYFSPEQRVAAMKIDVEGLELEVFRGATRILQEDRPLLVFECENRHMEEGQVFDVFESLHKLKYTGQFIRRNRAIDLGEFDPDVDQVNTGDRFWDRKDYVNNFIFRPVDRQ